MKSKFALMCVGLSALLAALWLAQDPLPAAQGQGKLPVPNPAAQEKALTLVLDVFGEDFKTATDNKDKAKLAALLFQQGKEVKDDAAVRYVCYREARDLAAKANDTPLALTIVEEIDR